MTKKISLLLVFAFALAFQSFAGLSNATGGQNAIEKKQGEDPKYDQILILDQQKLNAEFEQLNQLEEYLSDHEEMTLEELKSERPDLLENMTLSEDVSSTLGTKGYLSNGVAFLLGCVLGLIGLLIVGLVTEFDWEPIKWSLFGMLAWFVLGFLLFFVILGVGLAAF